MPLAGPSQWTQLAASGTASLLILAALAIFLVRGYRTSQLIYGACAVVCSALAGVALCALSAQAGGSGPVELPVGLPLGRTVLGFDPLSATFAAIINIAIAIVS